MKDKNLVQTSLGNAVIVVVYVAAVSWLLENGEKLFGEMEKSFLAPLTFLLLFTFSALFVSSFLVGKPAMLYIDNRKKEAVTLLFYQAGWLALFLVTVLLTLIIRNR